MNTLGKNKNKQNKTILGVYWPYQAGTPHKGPGFVFVLLFFQRCSYFYWVLGLFLFVFFLFSLGFLEFHKAKQQKTQENMKTKEKTKNNLITQGKQENFRKNKKNNPRPILALPGRHHPIQVQECLFGCCPWRSYFSLFFVF